MKNNITVCKNCGGENPLYQLICTKCQSYLRERVYNIDLFSTIAQLIENPLGAFKRIIYSEHKNFLVFLFIIISVKFFINIYFMASLRGGLSFAVKPIAIFVIVLCAGAVLLILFSIIYGVINRVFKIDTRFKDNLSIFIYSLLPHFFGAAILFPVELIIFGEYLFDVNPSPFEIKPFFAYTLLAFEGILTLWSVFLSTMASYAQSRKLIYSLIMGLTFHSILFLFQYTITLII